MVLGTLGCGTTATRSTDGLPHQTQLGPNPTPILAPRASVAPVETTLDLSPEGHDALLILLRTQVFTDASVGDLGVTPKPVLALRALVLEPQAKAALLYLTRKAPLAGQLFALCGLYQVAPLTFEGLIEAYRDRPDRVSVLFGCTFMRMQVRELMTSYHPWDITRGGYPRMLLGLE